MILHEDYGYRSELRTARTVHRCNRTYGSWWAPTGTYECGAAISPGEQYVVETSLPFSDGGPHYRTENVRERVFAPGGLFLYAYEKTVRVPTVRTSHLCLRCAESESPAYRRHAFSSQAANDATPTQRSA